MTLAKIARIALVLLAPAAVHAQAAGKTDVTGKWLFSVTTDGGTGTPTLTFTQKGDSITGHYSSQLLGESDFNGTVKGNQIAFSFVLSAQGQSLTVTYAGTVESADTMKGTAEFGGLGSGTFTAKKQP